MRQGFLIPLYNHPKPLPSLVAQLNTHGLPIVIVDDGSNQETQQALAQVSAVFSNVVTLRLERNSGKGAAFWAGLKRAREMGLSHVLQVDADGQHEVGRAGFFLEASAKQPEALICGFPEFDESAPLLRKRGRKLSNLWTSIVCLSGGIADALCGFRVYPTEKTLFIFEHAFVDKRMAFDTEILVRLSWAGVPLVFFPVKVRYPQDGVSHFRLFWDNARISWMFSRLCCGMLLRLPLLLLRKWKKRPA
ncbi:MAG: glycosyltransferase family 2 protein [Proteobacteria bacterium]|nr:glycosyltransferase family 2 protein [Cystobacterineae bacterium]MCL2259484.1 glycosyltransferase family 2 protein [Cystobacterineae bacterium]MCL2313881.1 glycosyltransferase family 2 protein [Pseudomonadota bacterium]